MKVPYRLTDQMFCAGGGLGHDSCSVIMVLLFIVFIQYLQYLFTMTLLVYRFCHTTAVSYLCYLCTRILQHQYSFAMTVNCISSLLDIQLHEHCNFY